MHDGQVAFLPRTGHTQAVTSRALSAGCLLVATHSLPNGQPCWKAASHSRRPSSPAPPFSGAVPSIAEELRHPAERTGGFFHLGVASVCLDKHLIHCERVWFYLICPNVSRSPCDTQQGGPSLPSPSPPPSAPSSWGRRAAQPARFLRPVRLAFRSFPVARLGN